MYEEQIRWAKEAGVDFVVAETINWTGEMEIALKAIKQEGLIAVTNYCLLPLLTTPNTNYYY